jgi:predicted aspartyl protease
MRYLSAFLLLFAVIASAEDVSLPIVFCKGRNAMTVLVEVNGKPHRFLVDTGAESTIVSREAVGFTMVDLRKASFSRSGPGIGGDAAFTRVDLKLGDRNWSQQSIVVMDLQYVRALYGKDIDGLLGQDVLHQFSSFKVDFKNRQLVLAN